MRASWSVGSAAAICVKSSRSSSLRRDPPMGSSPNEADSSAGVTGFGFRGGRLRRGRGLCLVAREIGTLEERVLGEVAFELLVQLDRRQLEQPDRLLQLRRERQVLG